MAKAQITRSKYGVRTDALGRLARTIDGITFDSELEARHYAELKLLKKAGKIAAFVRQIRIPLLVNSHLVCDIVIDYRVDYIDGTIVFHEVKGYETAVWKLKAKLFRALYPNAELVIITKDGRK